MNKQVHIDYDPADHKFTIRCPYYANDMIHQLPAVRWSKKLKAWRAPITRKNAQVIDDVLGPYAVITDAARIMLDESRVIPAEQQGPPFPSWYTFKTDPEPYQLRCEKKLYPLKAAAIHADMGTGKSKMAIDMAAARRMEGAIDALVIVAKFSLRMNWLEQLDIHCPIPFSAMLPETTARKQFERWLADPYDFKILIVGTESLSQGGMRHILEEFVQKAGKVMMVIDESSYIAGYDADRSLECVRIGRDAVFRLTMSGTPIKNNPLDFFMQFEFLDPNIIGIGDYFAFRNRYAVMGGYAPKEGRLKGRPLQVVGFKNLDELSATVAPYVFQVSKEEAGLNIPPKQLQTRVLPMTGAQRELYNQIKKDKSYMVNDTEQNMRNSLELCLRLHQVCGGFKAEARDTERTVKGERRIQRTYDMHPIFNWDKNPKIIELDEILQQVRDRSTIIWCAYLEEMAIVRHLLMNQFKGKIANYHGGIDEAQRDEYDKGFQAGNYQYMVANQQTGGMGLNWQIATLVVYFSNTNKMIDRVQSEDRAHRRGQYYTVDYIDLAMEKSIDITISHANKLKIDLAAYVRAKINNAREMEKVYDGQT